MSTQQAPVAVERQPRGRLARYLADSRNPLNSALLILPVFLIYSIGILSTHGVRNGVDLVSDFLRGVVFRSDLQYLLFNLAGMLLLVVVALVLRKRHQFNPRIYLLVVAEGAFYGFLLAQGVPRLLAMLGIVASPHLAAGPLIELGPVDRFVLSLGAGLWEEIIFRLVLLGGSVLLMTRVLKLRPAPAWLIGVVSSSLAFSAVHYVGSMGDPLELYSFMFRFFAGIVFAAIFALRGLAVAVYTHAVYDVMVLVVLGLAR